MTATTELPPPLPLELWPEVDRRRWMGSPDVKRWLAEAKAGESYARSSYGLFLAMAKARGRPAMPDATSIRLFRDELTRRRSPWTVLSRLEHLAYALRVVRPAHDWSWLVQANREMRQRLNAPARTTGLALGRPHRQAQVVPLQAWPAADRERWEAAFAPPRPPARRDRYRRRAADGMVEAPATSANSKPDPGWRSRAGRHPSSWSDAYRKRIERGYGLWLGWLRRTGRPEASFTYDDVAEFVEALASRGASGVSLATWVYELWRAVTLMRPQDDWAWLEESWRALQADARPVRDKRRKLIPLEDLLALGVTLMNEALIGAPTVAKAIRFRDGLLIAFAAYRPKRARNLAELRLGRQVVTDSSGVPVLLCWDETKNHDPSEAAFPTRLVSFWQIWLDRFRPLLTNASGSDAVWLSQRGHAMTANELSRAVARRTRAAFGIALSLHMWRTLYATSLIAEDAKLRASVSHMLDHRDKRSLKHYELDARAIGGSKALDRSLAPLLAGMTPPRRACRRQSARPLTRAIPEHPE